MDYTKASDFEINKLIAIRQGLLVAEIDDSSVIGIRTGYREKYHTTIWCAKTDNNGVQVTIWEQVNYCNSWEDMGPIIADNGISISKIDKNDTDWAAFFFWGNTEVYDQNPLRAAAIVYLMMGDT